MSARSCVDERWLEALILPVRGRYSKRHPCTMQVVMNEHLGSILGVGHLAGRAYLLALRAPANRQIRYESRGNT
eukprot:scaffold12759_cov75-Skeletonema_dohrnii-CCMP3373.AAC.1